MGLGYGKPAASLLSFDYMDLNNYAKHDQGWILIDLKSVFC